MKKSISVIIPTYNSEYYLDNLLNQLTKNIALEIIVVNDGSTDNTDKIVKKYNNIKYISYKKNKGIAYARNKGLEKITSEYFTFIDSDDVIDKDMLDIMYKECKNNDLDMCICNYNEIIDNKSIKSKYKYDNQIYNNKKLLEKTFKDQVSTIVWAKLYKTKTYKSIKFNENLKINEDYEFTIKCFKLTRKVKLLDKYLYKYYINNNSITNNLKCVDIKNNNYLDYLKDLKLKKYKYYDYFININELRNIHLFSKCIDKKNRYKYLKKNINKNNLNRLLKEKIPLFNKIEILIFNISIKLYLLIYPLCIIIRNKIRR